MNLSLFSSELATPMTVIELNGKKLSNSYGWKDCVEFPNPAAANMITSFKKLEKIMGERLASTIVEYLDKDTNDPVAMLFPTNEIMYRDDIGQDFTQRLNHATRQDLRRQLAVRERFLKKLTEKQK